jgi:DNA-binding MarR family transcriptional regulator
MQKAAILAIPEGNRHPQLGRLGDFVGFRMRRVQNRLSNKFSEATKHYGLRSGLFSSLAIISANPGISQQELSTAVGLDKSITVQIIDELENRGYARRERSRIDRRRHSLTATAEGETVLDELFAIMAQVEGEVLEELSTDEREILHEMLDRMHAVFDL